jgi:AraC-like DNA-binding protein
MATSTQLALSRVREANPEAFCETMAPISKLWVRPVAGSDSLATHTLAPLITKYREAYIDELATASDTGSRLEKSSRPTKTFLRFLDFVWRELQNRGSFLPSPIATTETEDALYTLFVDAINAGRPRAERRSACVAGPSRLLRASDYIDSKLTEGTTVPEIAEADAVSVPTLNRTFRKYYGMGPKSVVKQRRLESVRQELLECDPEETTVTRIAVKYGFTHLGQFAADYKRMFFEHPSTTLRKRQ